MNKRGVITVSVLFGLFALSFGVLGVQALTLGPDAPVVSKAAIAKRTATADQVEARIRQAAKKAPPALPTVPARVSTPAAVGGTGSAPVQQVITLPAPRAAPSGARAGDDHGEGEGDSDDHGKGEGDDHGESDGDGDADD